MDIESKAQWKRQESNLQALTHPVHPGCSPRPDSQRSNRYRCCFKDLTELRFQEEDYCSPAGTSIRRSHLLHSSQLPEYPRFYARRLAAPSPEPGYCQELKVPDYLWPGGAKFPPMHL